MSREQPDIIVVIFVHYGSNVKIGNVQNIQTTHKSL